MKNECQKIFKKIARFVKKVLIIVMLKMLKQFHYQQKKRRNLLLNARRGCLTSRADNIQKMTRIFKKLFLANGCSSVARHGGGGGGGGWLRSADGGGQQCGGGQNCEGGNNGGQQRGPSTCKNRPSRHKYKLLKQSGRWARYS